MHIAPGALGTRNRGNTERQTAHPANNQQAPYHEDLLCSKFTQRACRFTGMSATLGSIIRISRTASACSNGVPMKSEVSVDCPFSTLSRRKLAGMGES